MQEEIIEGFRLSPQQRRLWSLQEGGHAFRAQCVLRLAGPLDVTALKGAVAKIVASHEILRTTFHRIPGMKFPVQLVSEHGTPLWREIDLSHLDQQRSAPEIEDLWMKKKRRPFALDRGPVLCLTLVTQSAFEHLLLVSLPAVCADSWTLKNFARQLAASYGASVLDDVGQEEVIQYIQFAEWQNELLGGEDAETGRRFWESLRPQAWPTQHLPYEMTSPAAGEFAPEQVTISIQPETRSRLLGVVDRHGLSIDGFLLATWHSLIWRLAGGDEVMVGRIFPGRELEALTDAFGLFGKSLPTVARFTPYVPFSSVARHLASSIPAMVEAQEYFEIDKYLDGAPNPGGGEMPFFPFVFSFEEWPAPIHADELIFAIRRHCAGFERYRVMLNISRAEDFLQGEFFYDPLRFDGDDVRYMAGLFERLLSSAIENPETSVSDLEILDETERRELSLNVEKVQTDVPKEACVHVEFEDQAARTPDRVAAVFGDQHLTYLELNERANQVARSLRRRGVQREARVGVLMERSVEMVWAVIGVLKAGAAYVPLDVMSPGVRVRQMIEDAGADVVLTEQRWAESLVSAGVRAVSVNGAERAELEAESRDPVANTAKPENLAYVIYTSGSTGKPKGVMVSHGSASNLAAALKESVYEGLGKPVRVGLNAPLTFDASVKQLLQLLNGHTLELLPEEVRYDAAEMLSYGRRRGIDVLDCTPAQLRSLIGAGLLDERNFSFSTVLAGGDALDEKTWRLLARSTTTRFYNLYGPTECTVDATVCPIQPEQARVSLGRSIANARVHVLDPELRQVPRGVEGEILIGGAGVARGYLGRAELTAERFIPDPFGPGPGSRLYRTGDLARRFLRGLEFVRREDHQIKIRGFRVESGEIEAVLKMHAAVRDAVVVARDDSSGERELVAYTVVHTTGEHPMTDAESTEALRRFLRESLPEFMIPSAFVLLDALPLNRHGKVDRAALPDPERRNSASDKNYVAPRNDIERAIATVWQQVLELEKVGVRDNFFDLGGHSLLMARAYTKLRETIGREFSMIDLFRFPTVSSLAEFLSEGDREDETVMRSKVQERVGRQRAAHGRQKDLVAGRKSG